MRWTLLLLLLCAGAHAQDDGTVRLPLARYQELIAAQTRPGYQATYAFSDVSVRVEANEEDGHASAEVTVDASVHSFGADWTLVPLGAGIAISHATVDGAAAELVGRGGSVAWPAHGEGTHRLEWAFHVEASRSGGSWVLAIPTPETGGTILATVPGVDAGAVVIPASNASITNSGDRTSITATLPSAAGVQVSWRADGGSRATISRASYQGSLVGEGMRLSADLVVETAGRAEVPLFPSSIALEELSVDNVEVPILAHDNEIYAVIPARGRHRVHASFLVPVGRAAGLPQVTLDLPTTPVAAFQITLPGEHELHVTTPNAEVAGVVTQRRGGSTQASFHVPLSDEVTIDWTEAVPDQAEQVETRAHANLVHLVRPDDGVLTMRTFASWEIARGSLSRVELDVPDGLQINTVECAQATVSDWRVTGENGARVLTIYLDRAIEDQLALQISSERTWPASTRTTDAFAVPILRARDVSRQRGMIALLANRELTLEPRDEQNLSRVGDNALPAEVRGQIEGTVAHTWRYLDDAPRLIAIGAVRAPEAARYDAEVDTLVSLGEVSTSVVAQVQIEVKSGALSELRVRIPSELSVLEVSAPSLRRYRLEDADGGKVLIVELTQPMEGRFTVELTCERITGQEDQLAVPLVGVAGAEVERGRVGVEALAAFQVDAATAEHLSPIDPSELPEPLLLRTDNPILLAYRYAQAQEPPRFSVRITRHQEIQTRQAAIDEAVYRTLYTADGVAVTTARFFVRNRRQQFLRVTLPEGSEVWSATVDGHSESPALESGSHSTVLLNIVSAAQGFQVEMVYATRVSPLGTFGRLDAQLPQLDMVVTRTRWELYLPAGAEYSEPRGSLTVVEAGTPVSGQTMAPSAPLPEGLSLEVPADGVRYVFQKMYAGRSGDVVSVSIPYVRGWGGPFASLLSLLGALLMGLGLLAFGVLRLGLPIPASVSARLPAHLATYRDSADAHPPRSRDRKLIGAVLGVAAFGGLLLLATIGYLSTTPWIALAVVTLIGLGALGMAVKHKIDSRPKPAPQAPVAEAPPAQ